MSPSKLGLDEEAMLSDIQENISPEYFSSCRSLDFNSFTEEEMIAFENTFNYREWWRRLWIVQECVLARKAVILCGSHSILLDTVHLIRLGRVLEDPAGPDILQGRILRAMSSATITGLLRYNRMAPYRVLWPENLFPGMYYTKRLDVLLGMFRNWNTTDPRDMIYALLGLTHIRWSQIVPDYTNSLATVYSNLTVSLMQGTGSWVPDYRPLGAHHPLVHLNLGNEQLYRASSASKLDLQALRLANQGILTLHGVFWGRIQVVSEPVSDNFWGSQLRAAVRNWQRIGITSNLYNTGETAIDAFWRTLLRDYIAETDVINGIKIKALK
jgi:hypothetical protein